MGFTLLTTSFILSGGRVRGFQRQASTAKIEVDAFIDGCHDQVDEIGHKLRTLTPECRTSSAALL
jgi:hypothetical protein